MLRSYHFRQKLKKYFTLGLMYVILIVNLFPIAWMIFSSFKNNSDILLGKIGFSRAVNDVVLLQKEGPFLYVGTSDGGLSKYDFETHNLLDFTTFTSLSTAFYFGDSYIDVSSSDRGLFRVSKADFSKRTERPLPFKGININSIGTTSICSNGKYIWYGVENPLLNKIYEFTAADMKMTDIIELNADVEIKSMAVQENTLLIGTNKELFILDITTKEIVKKITLPSDYYPIGSQTISFLADNKARVFTPMLLMTIDLSTDEIIKEPSPYGELISYDEDNDYQYFGTITQLIKKNKTTHEETIFQKLFPDINVNQKIADVKPTFVLGSINAFTRFKDTIIIGSTYGRVVNIDETTGEIENFLQTKAGHILFMWRNYVDLWSNIDFGLYMYNSFFISGMTMIFSMIFATLTAYALVRFNFPGSRIFGTSILATQMVPGILYLIPFYIMFKFISDHTGIQIKGTYFGLIFIYTAFFTPFSIWILRGFFSAIPKDLEEAATIDGCSQFKVFWKIVLPLAVPGIIATGVYMFLNAWDELMFAWVLTNKATMTIPVGIRLFVGNFQNRFDLMMAAATVATIPVIILFFLLQKHIVKGLTAGAVKG